MQQADSKLTLDDATETVVSREAWERPVLERLAAQEAQNSASSSGDSNINNS